MTEEEKKDIEEKVEELRKVLSTDKIDEIKSKTQALGQSAYKIAEKIYRSQAETAAAGGDGSPGGKADGDKKDDKVVDADFKPK